MVLSKRIEWADIIKGFAILFVVIGHSNSSVNRYIYIFHVPAFFFLSGFLTIIDKKSVKLFLWDKLKALIIPFLSINILFLILTVILSYTKIGKFLYFSAFEKRY